jgi:GT2 family glycosyltransferase
VPASQPQVTVVIATRDRARGLLRTLGKLAALPCRPPVIVIDNNSSDGTPHAVRDRFPDVRVIRLRRNLAAAGRNTGVQAAGTPYVAFSDDDSWWHPGSLRAAAAALDGCGRLGVVAARTLVGPAGADDPVNAAMRASPLPRGDLPGPRVLGFLSCACVVRRSAFLEVGGFSELLGIGGEEALLAMDLAAAGWDAAYLDQVVAEHWPSPVRDAAGRRRLQARNQVLTAWLRRPLAVAASQTLSLAGRAACRREAAGVVAGLAAALPAALRGRRRLPRQVEEHVRLLAAAAGDGGQDARNEL